MKKKVSINHRSVVQWQNLSAIEKGQVQLSLARETSSQIKAGYKGLQSILESAKEPVYGINTGFGSLCNTVIPKKDLQQLQENLVMSHACGTGEVCEEEIIRLMIYLKVEGLAKGHSGVQPQTVELLTKLYNEDILPEVFTQGSLGASGDLAPLAHLCLPLIGMGKVKYVHRWQSTREVFKKHKLSGIKLGAKEGLALLNGTQFMSAYACHILLRAQRCREWADLIAAASMDAFNARTEPFEEILHQIRPHKGQLESAEAIRKWRRNSAIAQSPKTHVQDAYAFRCVPQVHGASYDAIDYAGNVVNTEINSVTDNPTVFISEKRILSGGNFHGQPLALALDFLAIALAELGSISERRTYQLISGTRNLPAFLTNNAGLHSGFMIPQYTAASLVSQSKQLCTPASVDSIVSSNGQEDHVSMGANAATKCKRVVENTLQVLAIELLNAMQALDLRGEKSSRAIEKLRRAFRSKVSFNDKDRVLHHDLVEAKKFIMEHETHQFEIK
jgi:histidine ammonia-lyase